MNEYLFSSESVTEGHPDKICDQISDSILDEYLKKDPNSRVACETLAAKNVIVIAGEISSSAQVDIPQVVKDTITKIGYTDPAYGLDISTYKLITSINKQSDNIAQGVDTSAKKEQGAGDQGLMFGYACDETPELMPLPISMAHKLTQRLAQVRKENILKWLRPDGKAQVTFKYINDQPIEITSIVLSTQHDTEITHEQIEKEIKEHVILPVCEQYLTPFTKYFINPTGVFEIGGPQADCGLTGRKIIVDTYGGIGRHGGGCFSGKDATKVDRSASYMARYIAKNIVASKIAKKCEVQIAYSIGIADPVSLYINTFGTSNVDDQQITKTVLEIFPLKPAEIIEYLDLKNPIFSKTSIYGHFGREDQDFTWEKTDKIEELLNKLNHFIPANKSTNELEQQEITSQTIIEKNNVEEISK
ncbi:methionine adenosyltransferase [Candidatus Dependentiae bacterium]|nr:methionine adenosyltransferase [Candidatus Dependentiae bacterium]